MPLSTTFSGLDHLTGETVEVLGDGCDMGTPAVAAGAIALPGTGASYAVAGLGSPPLLVTMPFEPSQAANQSAQGRVKRIDTLYVRFLETVGGTYGVRQRDPMTFIETDKTEDIVSRSAADPMGQPVPLLTGIRRLKMPGGYDQEGRVLFTQKGRLPLTLLSIGARADVAEVMVQ